METIEKAVKIKCCFCEIKDTCSRRAQKEKYEVAGWTTRCTVTPNRPGAKRKKRKKQKKALKV